MQLVDIYYLKNKPPYNCLHIRRTKNMDITKLVFIITLALLFLSSILMLIGLLADKKIILYSFVLVHTWNGGWMTNK